MTGQSPANIMFSDAVRQQQTRRGSRQAYARMEERGAFKDKVTSELAEFIANRDSFYLATAGANGQPYIQHRGGTPGFLKVLDESRLGFADFSGNKQYISIGNLSENDQVFLFLMDYANRRRIKIWGKARVVEDDADLLARLVVEGYGGRPERAIVIEVTAWDANCPQHITPRFTEQEIAAVLEPYRQRIRELEAEIRQRH